MVREDIQVREDGMTFYSPGTVVAGTEEAADVDEVFLDHCRVDKVVAFNVREGWVESFSEQHTNLVRRQWGKVNFTRVHDGTTQ